MTVGLGVPQRDHPVNIEHDDVVDAVVLTA